ncbi:MAG: glycosyltransferase family 2 protein [Acetobacter sp.]|nr:glycosyltransferase family 2 protein [Acetobacter sp.]
MKIDAVRKILKVKSLIFLLVILGCVVSYAVLKNPKVSIVMPVYNGAKYLDRTISFTLESTFKDFEFIVIDDGSTDNSYEILQRWAEEDSRVKVYKNLQNMGIAKTRNRGFELARGKYIAPMDQDDISLTERLELSVKYLDEHQDVDLVDVGTISLVGYNKGIKDERAGAISYLIGDKAKEKNLFTLDEQDENIKLNLFFSLAYPVQSGALMRKAFFIENNVYYREDIKYADDYALYLDMIKKGVRFHHIDDIQHIYNDVREHSSAFLQEQYDESIRIKSELHQWAGLNYRDYIDLGIGDFMCAILKDLKKTNLELKRFSQALIEKDYDLLCVKKIHSEK